MSTNGKINWHCYCLAENQADEVGYNVCEKCKQSYYISASGAKVDNAKSEKNTGISDTPLEQVVSTIANVILALGLVTGVILFFVGIASFGETRDNWGRVQAVTGWAQLLVSMYMIVISLVVWALLRVLSNISTSLKEINAKTESE